MLLLIDAGNTRVKWAIAHAGAAVGDWAASGAVGHDAIATLGDCWRASGIAVSHSLLSNVAGAAIAAQLEAQASALTGQAALTRFTAQAQRAGVRNGYRNPAQLGSDRFAAAIGARCLLPGQALVIATCGTATTVDALDADGLFKGGMILPGLGLMAASLARGTAQLPQIADIATLPAGFADNTDDAILSGCLAAQAGAIERAVALLEADQCLLSGGAALFVAPALRIAFRHIDNLVLLGLHAAFLAKD